jgi:hydrogenase expression/formation protein HypC
VGDFVVVHLGYAVDRVSAEEAAAAWEIYDQLLAAEAADTAAMMPGLGTKDSDSGPLA